MWLVGITGGRNLCYVLVLKFLEDGIWESVGGQSFGQVGRRFWVDAFEEFSLHLCFTFYCVLFFSVETRFIHFINFYHFLSLFHFSTLSLFHYFFLTLSPGFSNP